MTSTQTILLLSKCQGLLGTVKFSRYQALLFANQEAVLAFWVILCFFPRNVIFGGEVSIILKVLLNKIILL